MQDIKNYEVLNYEGLQEFLKLYLYEGYVFTNILIEGFNNHESEGILKGLLKKCGYGVKIYSRLSHRKGVLTVYEVRGNNFKSTLLPADNVAKVQNYINNFELI